MHLEKYIKTNFKKMLAHYLREPESYKNKNIDKTKSHLNYSFHTNEDVRVGKINEYEFIENRLGEVKVFNRKDVVKMADIVLTKPKEFQGNDEEFFGLAFEHLAEKVGPENVIGGYVHNDETQPHMHFSFIPIYKDPETGKEKLSCKQAVPRSFYQNLHPDMAELMNEHFGYDVGILNGALDDRYNEDMETFKINSKKRAENEIRAEYEQKFEDEYQSKVNRLNEQQRAFEEEIRVFEDYKREQEEELEEKRQKNEDEYKEMANKLKGLQRAIDEQKRLFEEYKREQEEEIEKGLQEIKENNVIPDDYNDLRRFYFTAYSLDDNVKKMQLGKYIEQKAKTTPLTSDYKTAPLDKYVNNIENRKRKYKREFNSNNVNTEYEL